MHEAYEVLTDAEKREEYELEHPNIHEEWKRYHRDMEDWERRTTAEAEAEAERAKNRTREEEAERRRWIWIMGKNERARRTASEREEQYHYDLFGNSRRCFCYCRGCKDRNERLRYDRHCGLDYPTPEEYEEYLRMRAERAERRSREAARKQREQQEREAKERIRKEQVKIARQKEVEERKRAARARMSEQRSNQAAHRAREEQEMKAKRHMAEDHVKQQQEKFLAERGDDVFAEELYVIDIGWKKKQGVAQCTFCEAKINHFAFLCPEGGASACNPCKNYRCRFKPAKKEEEVEAQEDQEESQIVQEEEDASKEGLNDDEGTENVRPSN